MQQKEFWEVFESNDDWRFDYRNWLYFKISESELRKEYIEVEPNTDLTGEDDPPGPVSRWYGFVEEVPILFDLHHCIPEGPGVMIRYVEMPGAREKIRNQFSSWGKEWLESEIE